MDPAYISAISGLGGTAVGALATFVTTWLTLNAQERASRRNREMSRRENLYGEFIEEASKLYSDALVNRLDDTAKFVRFYALSSKPRLFASADVLSKVEELMQRIFETYEILEKHPHFTMKGQDPREVDILRPFSEACRRELNL
jgi:hypothetical protein